MRCPSCGTRLVEMERSDVLIDACPGCRGVWLDRGELDKLLDKERRLATGVRDDDDDFFREMGGERRGQGQPPPRREEREPPRKRRRGLLEDLFDFD